MKMETCITASQMIRFLDLLTQKGIVPEEFEKILNSNILSEFFETETSLLEKIERDEFRNFLGLGPREKKILINYSLNIRQMIEAGNYYWIDGIIATSAVNFRILGTGKKEVKCELIHIGKKFSARDADKEIEKRGFRSATIEEILAF